MMYHGISNDPINRALVTYPYVWWDNIFTDDELSLVTSYFEQQQLSEGTVGGKNLNEEIRKSKVNFSQPNQENKWIFDRFNLAIQQINSTFYGFDLNGYDQIQYSEYHPKDKYDWHIDMALGDRPPGSIIQTRKLSVAFLLNEPEKDFTGGQFEVATDLNDINEIDCKKGRIIAFPSWINHRVKPVTKGIRKSLVIWVLGPKFK